LVSTIFPTAPVWVGVAAGAGIGSLESDLEYDRNKQSRKKNGLVYLLEARQTFGPHSRHNQP